MRTVVRRVQQGLSLVEVMVAVVIGMVGILVITQAYITSDNFNRATLGEGGAQMNGLVALYSVERDVRMAGWGINHSTALGCGNINWYYTPSYSSNIGGGSRPNIVLAPVVITHNSGTPATPDQITIMYASDGERMMPTTIATFSASASDVAVDGTDGFSVGDLVLLVKSTGCTLGKITGIVAVSQKLQLLSGTGGEFNPSAWGSFPVTYAKDDTILNLGNPTLRTFLVSGGKLQTSDGLLSTGTATATTLVDSVVDMRALYGKDTNADNIVDSYDTTTPTTAAGWEQVLSIKVGILARIGNFEKPSTSGGNCDATTAQPTWSGSTAAGLVTAANPFQAVDNATVTSQDRCYRYRVFETTVPIRNMIWRAS